MQTIKYSFQERFLQIQGYLERSAHLWRPQPYRDQCPDWFACEPLLASALIDIDEVTLLRVTDNDDARLKWLGKYLPMVLDIPDLCKLDAISTEELPPLPPHITSSIPGRKLRQIDHFSRAVGPIQYPIIEWCGGKGHLGRILTYRNRQPVDTLEIDHQLCGDGERLAKRVGVNQTFHPVDVLEGSVCGLGRDRHVVALHACGVLHRTMLHQVVEARSTAVDLAPCCYAHGAGMSINRFQQMPH